jgi:hypothetical protein
MSRENTRQINAEHNLYPIEGGGQTLAVDDTAGGVPFAAFPAGTRCVEFQVRDQAVTMTTDGTAPVASGAGQRLAVGDRRILSIERARKAKFIRTGGTNGSIWAEALAF